MTSCEPVWQTSSPSSPVRTFFIAVFAPCPSTAPFYPPMLELSQYERDKYRSAFSIQGRNLRFWLSEIEQAPDFYFFGYFSWHEINKVGRSLRGGGFWAFHCWEKDYHLLGLEKRPASYQSTPEASDTTKDELEREGGILGIKVIRVRVRTSRAPVCASRRVFQKSH